MFYVEDFRALSAVYSLCVSVLHMEYVASEVMRGNERSSEM